MNSAWDPLEKHETLFSKKKKSQNANTAFIFSIQTGTKYAIYWA